MNARHHPLKVLGGVALVAGTTVGGGMLGLPIATGAAGFFPTAALFILCWSMMLLTAFYFLEVNLSLKGNPNIITMAKETLGPSAQAVTWVLYLLLLYALTAAYLAASGPILAYALQQQIGFEIPHTLQAVPILLLFGVFVYMGTRSVDLINRVMILGLSIVYLVVMWLITEQVDISLWDTCHLKYLMIAGPFAFLSFGYHIIIPSLTTYFERDKTTIRKVLLIGSIIPLIVYLAWQGGVLGIVPLEGPMGLLESHRLGLSVVPALSMRILGFSWLVMIFSFFLIITSFLGVSLSLCDFLADGLGIRQTAKGRLGVASLTFVPPLVFTLVYPQGFILALEYGGVFVALLLGILPAAMVWGRRYKKGLDSPYQAPGGKKTIFFTIVFFCVMLLLTVLERLDMLSFFELR